MKRTVSIAVRLLILLAGLALSGYLVWRLVGGARIVDFDVETQGPLIVVVFGLLLLLTLGAAVSFYANQHLASTAFLGGILAVMSFVLWLRYPGQANIYRLYFIYGLMVGVLSPLVLDRHH